MPETTDAEAALREASPIGRDDLADAEVVEAAYRAAGETGGVAQTPHGVTVVLRGPEHRNFTEREVASALSYHGLADTKRTSRAFETRLRRADG